MTDLEILKLAAKAGGLDGATYNDALGVMHYPYRSPLTDGHYWNCLTDDGDAARLAVHLQMEVRYMGPRCYAKIPNVTELADVFHNDDPAAAARRAISLTAVNYALQTA